MLEVSVNLVNSAKELGLAISRGPFICAQFRSKIYTAKSRGKGRDTSVKDIAVYEPTAGESSQSDQMAVDLDEKIGPATSSDSAEDKKLICWTWTLM